MTIYKTTIPELKLKAKDGNILKVKIKSSDDLHLYFRELFNKETLEIQEEVIVVFLNNSNNTIGWYKVSQGGITGSVIDIRLVMKKALDCYATQMCIAHNHPSGGLTPSQNDKDITAKLKQACNILDIKLLDHIIITAENYYSFTNDGLL